MRNRVEWLMRLFGRMRTGASSRRGMISVQVKPNECLNKSSGETNTKDGNKYDMIGPVDKISNLRRYSYYVPANESRVEREYRAKREFVAEFNQQYWAEQNLRFVEARRAFVARHKRRNAGAEPSTAEINEFYKSFLNDNYYNHYMYNQKWIKYNFELLWPACKVFFYRLNKRILK